MSLSFAASDASAALMSSVNVRLCDVGFGASYAQLDNKNALTIDAMRGESLMRRFQRQRPEHHRDPDIEPQLLRGHLPD